MAQIEGVIFDLDGTLLDTLDDLADSMNAVLEGAALRPHPVDAYQDFIGDGMAKLVERALPGDARDEATIEKYLEAYRAEYGARWNQKSKPYAGIAELLDELVRREVKLAVLSNKPDAFTQKCVAELLPDWTFDVVLGQTDHFPRKPDPTSAKHVAGALCLAPQEMAFVGDSGVDIRTGSSAGMLAVGVAWGFRPTDELLQAGATEIIVEPADLLPLLG